MVNRETGSCWTGGLILMSGTISGGGTTSMSASGFFFFLKMLDACFEIASITSYEEMSICPQACVTLRLNKLLLSTDSLSFGFSDC